MGAMDSTNEGAAATAGAPASADVRRIGQVASSRMQKTIVVKVERRVMHPIYKKYVKRYTRLVAHDETNDARAGDTVEIAFCRPLSRTKRWKLVRVIARAPGGEA